MSDVDEAEMAEFAKNELDRIQREFQQQQQIAEPIDLQLAQEQPPSPPPPRQQQEQQRLDDYAIIPLSNNDDSLNSLRPRQDLDVQIIDYYLTNCVGNINHISGQFSYALCSVYNEHGVPIAKRDNDGRLTGEFNRFENDRILCNVRNLNELLFIPVHSGGVLGGHWTLLMVDPQNNRMLYFDSMHVSDINGTQIMTRFQSYLRDMQNEVVNYEKIVVNNCPQQALGSNDCGIFVLHYIECIATGRQLTSLTVDNVTQFRNRIRTQIVDHLQQQPPSSPPPRQLQEQQPEQMNIDLGSVRRKKRKRKTKPVVRLVKRKKKKAYLYSIKRKLSQMCRNGEVLSRLKDGAIRLGKITHLAMLNFHCSVYHAVANGNSVFLNDLFGKKKFDIFSYFKDV